MKGVVTINIGGNDRTLKFGINMSSHYCGVRKCSLQDYLDDIQNMFSFKEGDNGTAQPDFTKIRGDEIRDMIYSALWAHDMEKGIDPEYNRYTVGGWIDEADQKEINKIFTSLIASNIGDVKVDSDDEDGGKVKTKTKTKEKKK